MALKCAICGRDQNVNVVCHHCGHPLCDDEHCRYLIPDDPAFTQAPRLWQRVERLGHWLIGRPTRPTMVAFHCPSCKQTFHWYQRTISQAQWLTQEPVTDRQPQISR